MTSWFSKHRIWNHCGGNVTILFGMSGMALLFCAGAAINLVQYNNARTNLQAAADAAVLALASANEQSDVSTEAQKFVDTNLAGQNMVADTTSTASYNTASSEWKISITGHVKYALPNLFMRNEVNVAATATATLPTKLTEMKFRPGTAKGWFDKTVRLMAVLKPGSPPTELWRMDYKYNSGAPTITTTSSTWVDLQNATAVYMQMDIDPNSYGWNDFHVYQTNRTDQPDYVQYIKQDGTELTAPIDLATAAGCGETKSYNWEDGGDMDFMDFTFEATGQCESTTAIADVRLLQ